jgi:hypothetical protein
LNYTENPSWLAVKPLQNVVLETAPVVPEEFSKSTSTTTSSSLASSSTSSATPSNPNAIPVKHDDTDLDAPPEPRPIHISTLEIPVVYHDVLEIVPGLHARPPVLPADAPADIAPPPASNYDFIFHLGVAGRGPLRMERVGHKLGYHMKDAKGQLAPVVRVATKDFSRRDAGGDLSSMSSASLAPSAAEMVERERLGMEMVESGSDTIVRPTRGFGVGYETFPEEINTDIDVTKLVYDLRRSGIDQIYSSMDAGHYLCDFIYYCSLAEKKRSSKPYEKKRNTQVLFLHCPPVGLPLSTEEVTEAIKRIVVWVCEDLQVDDSKDDLVGVAAAAGVTVAK